MRVYVHKLGRLKFYSLQLLQHFCYAQTPLAEYGIIVLPTVCAKCKLLTLCMYSYKALRFVKTTYLPIFNLQCSFEEYVYK